jgi:hypothetical protein
MNRLAFTGYTPHENALGTSVCANFYASFVKKSRLFGNTLGSDTKWIQMLENQLLSVRGEQCVWSKITGVSEVGLLLRFTVPEFVATQGKS